MDLKLRNLERQALVGDVTATEALLREQQRMGLYNREHYVLGFPPAILRAGGILDLHQKIDFNFEIHFITATANAHFTFFITDYLGEWSNNPINSICLMKTNKYELIVPRFLKKDSGLTLALEDTSLAMNEVRLDFHGIRTT